jgi:hypothetical protein
MNITCDNCKRQLEPFKLENSDDTGYGFVVDDGEVEVLMSDMTYAFCCFTEPDPVRKQGKQYWCVKCIEAICK